VAAGFSCLVAKNVPSDALKRDSPEALPNGVEAETTAGNSGKLQFRVPCTSSASWCMVPARWQIPFPVAEASARPQFWTAQSGAHAGATTRAPIASRLNARSAHLALRIRITLGILW